jgi:hypothetical protein
MSISADPYQSTDSSPAHTLSLVTRKDRVSLFSKSKGYHRVRLWPPQPEAGYPIQTERRLSPTPALKTDRPLEDECDDQQATDATSERGHKTIVSPG